MLTKTAPVQLKAAGPADGLEEGQFEAIVSVFGNIDSYGDKVMPGAFAKTLGEWEASGDPIPVYWSHRMDDPEMNLGHVLDAEERPAKNGSPAGLWVKAQLDLEQGGKAAQTYRLMKGRRVTQFSFAYDVRAGGWEKDNEEEFYALRDLKLYEVGPTPVGANQETDLLAVKAAGEHVRRFIDQVKAGRVLSGANENTLKGARDLLTQAVADLSTVLKAVETDDSTDEGKASTTGSRNDETRQRKSEDATRDVTAELAKLDMMIELDALLATG